MMLITSVLNALLSVAFFPPGKCSAKGSVRKHTVGGQH